MLTIKTPEQRYWRCSGVITVNFEQIPHVLLMFSIVDLGQVNAAWFKLLLSNCFSFCLKLDAGLLFRLTLKKSYSWQISKK